MELESQNLDSEFSIFAFKDEQKPSPDQPGKLIDFAFNKYISFLCVLKMIYGYD